MLTIALDGWIAVSARSASTSRLMVSSLTDGILGAAVLVTGRSADAVEPLADLVFGAVFVVLTSGLGTRDPGVSLGTRWTGALSLMGYGHALGTPTANDVVGQAGSYADIVAARFVVGTVVVRSTFSC